ncbi:amino acid permease [Streptomyces tricolor]|nr:amino acid permease [Streptomyces tricolor]
MGQIGGTAATGYAAATFIQVFVQLQWPSYQPSAHQTVLITALIIVVQGLANTFTVQLVAILNRISVWWLLIGLVVIVGALIVMPDHHQSASFVTHFENNTGFTSGLYGGMLGLLVTSWTSPGSTAASHVRGNGPRDGQRPEGDHPRHRLFGGRRAGPDAGAGLQHRRPTPGGRGRRAARADPHRRARLRTAKLMLLIVIGAMLFCGLANLTSNTRQIFAFSRDGAMLRLPLVALRLAAHPHAGEGGVARGRLLAGPWWCRAGGRTLAFTADRQRQRGRTLLAYAVPIFPGCGSATPSSPVPGIWAAGARPIGWLAVTWILLSSVLFMLPQARRSPSTPFQLRADRALRRRPAGGHGCGGSPRRAAIFQGAGQLAGVPTRSPRWIWSDRGEPSGSGGLGSYPGPGAWGRSRPRGGAACRPGPAPAMPRHWPRPIFVPRHAPKCWQRNRAPS